MGVIENLKDVVSLVQKADNIELYREVLQLQMDIYNLVEENNKLKEQLKNIEKNNDIEKELTYKENAYWIKSDGPYCTNCWDTKKNLVRLHSEDNIKGNCPNCKNKVIFNLETHNENHRKAMNKMARLNKQTSDYLSW